MNLALLNYSLHDPPEYSLIPVKPLLKKKVGFRSRFLATGGVQYYVYLQKALRLHKGNKYKKLYSPSRVERFGNQTLPRKSDYSVFECIIFKTTNNQPVLFSWLAKTE